MDNSETVAEGERKVPFWEVEHPYRPPEGNFFANWVKMSNYTVEVNSWDEFLEIMGNADPDYNFLYRWDYEAPDPDDYWLEEGDELPPSKLKFVYILQRKANFFYVAINNPRVEDEERIRAYLLSKWEYMRKLWAPLS